nr:non-specific lipid transfer protein 1a [Fagopyrum tataricum]
MAFSYTKLACLLIVCFAVAVPAAVEGFECGAVSKNLVQCITFLKGAAGPNKACCGGVRTLASMAQTPADRQKACGCLKNSAAAIPGLNLHNAAALPGLCQISVPYPISPSTDCSKVH